jgi:hypothetical protein
VLRMHGSRKRSGDKASDDRRTKQTRRAASDTSADQLELGV